MSSAPSFSSGAALGRSQHIPNVAHQRCILRGPGSFKGSGPGSPERPERVQSPEDLMVIRDQIHIVLRPQGFAERTRTGLHQGQLLGGSTAVVRLAQGNLQTCFSL